MSKENISPEEIAELCIKVADLRKAENLIKLEVKDYSVIADYFVICSGTSIPHVKALSEYIARELRNNHNLRPRSVEGTAESKWMLIDYVSVVVHIFTPESRELYDLEKLWGDAPKEVIDTLAKASPQK